MIQGMGRANFADPKAIRAWLRGRDGDNCFLCGELIDFTLPVAGKWPASPRSMGVTIDHRLPRSAGGRDDFANLHLAHGRCNQRKGAKHGVADYP